MTYTLWRLTKARYQDTAFSGYGAILHAGRWHRKGIPVVYVSESPALALLETMVHVEESDLLAFEYVAIPIRAEETHSEHLNSKDLPADWNAWPWPATTQQIGTQWVKQQRSVLLRVPSAVVPRQSNYLLNPTHPEFSQLDIGPAEPFPIDPRLVGRR